VNAATTLPREVALLERLAGGFGRSSLQYNQRHESDAELIRLPGTTSVLALTTDAISEEIESGLYTDPYFIGWMTVLVNASDLAAVGAAPIGILLSQTLPSSMADRELEALQRGVRDACSACGLPVLGGDTNFGTRLHMGACAVGLIENGRPLTRRGATAADRLFASGPLGLGGAFAFARLIQPDTAPPAFQPASRLVEGQVVRRYATCCMDTSDGVLATLDELSRLNGVGFALHAVEEILHPAAFAAARAAGLPPWFMLAGPHGEFELLFTVPEQAVAAFRAEARGLGWEPQEIGAVRPQPEISIWMNGCSARLDTRAIRDAYADAGGDARAYLARLLRLNQTVTLCDSP